MRIISPFKDYYDGVQRQGYDPLVTYVRKMQPVEFEGRDEAPFSDYVWVNWSDKSKNRSLIQTNVVIVAGKPYYRVQLQYSANPKLSILEASPEGVLYEDFFNRDKLYSRLISLGWNPERKPDRWRYRYLKDTHSTLDNFTNLQSPDSLTLAWNVALAYRSPIIAVMPPSLEIRRPHLILNPNLSNLGFQHVMDPYTLYQEVAMYVSGVLGAPGNPMVGVSDKTMVNKKGFDPKYGFRKRPHS